MRHRFAAAPLVVLLLASCSDDPAPPPTTFLEGDWTACYTETIATPVDVKATYTFFGPDYAYDLIGYTETADATCGGTGVLLDQDSGTIHVGAQVVADLGGVQVTAQAVDLQDRRTGERRYAIALVDREVEPDVLYLSDLAATPEERPASLRADRPLKALARFYPLAR